MRVTVLSDSILLTELPDDVLPGLKVSRGLNPEATDPGLRGRVLLLLLLLPLLLFCAEP